MASKAQDRYRSEAGQTGAEAQRQDRLPGSTCEEKIRRRAYEIYLARGGEPGHDLEDWLQAERELTDLNFSSTTASECFRDGV